MNEERAGSAALGIRLDETEKVGGGRLLTVAEVARWLRLKPSTIYTWAASGRIPCVRLGGRLRFVPNDVIRWIEARKEG